MTKQDVKMVRYLFCIVTWMLSLSPAHATPTAITAEKITSDETLIQKITTLKIKDLQKLTGRKFTLKEKIAFGILKHKLKRAKPADSNKGEMALIFGIGALTALALSLLLYPFFFGSLVAAILAILAGSSALKKDPSDKKAKTGKLLGWITLGLIAILLIIVVVTFSGSSWSWG